MAKPGLLNLDTTNTFQNWLDTTNEIVDIMKSEAITASVTGDTTGTSGSPLEATLFGSFTATSLSATESLITNSITPTSGFSEISFDSRVNIQTSSVVVAEFESTDGARTRYTGPNVNWDVGILSNATNSFTIDAAGVSGINLTLTTDGDLEVSGNFVGDLIGNVEGDVTGTVSDISNHNTDDLSEGSTNLYFTSARAQEAIGGQNWQIDTDSSGNLCFFYNGNLKFRMNTNGTFTAEGDITAFGGI